MLFIHTNAAIPATNPSGIITKKVRRVLIADEGKEEYGADTVLTLNPDVDDSAVNVSID